MVVIGIQSIFALCLGIAEIVFIGIFRDTQIDKECTNIINWLTAAAFINIGIPTLTCCGLRSLDKKECGGQYLQIAQIVIAIWATITYYHIDASCYNFWNSNTPELWTFVMIHFVIFWIIIGTICIIMICGFIICLKKNKNDTDDKNVSDNKHEETTLTTKIDINVQTENSISLHSII